MLSLPPEEAQELGGGGPGHPRGPGAGACLELLLQGGHEGPMQMRRRGARGQGLRSPRAPLLRRGWTKQQQKRHPPGACGLHALPSLRSASASPWPRGPLWLPQGPLGSGGSLWLARGSTAQSLGAHVPSLRHPLGGGGEGVGPAPRGWWHCPGPASRLRHCPDPSSAPRGRPRAGRSRQCPPCRPWPQSIMASSISRNSLCMGTLPSSFTP